VFFCNVTHRSMNPKGDGLEWSDSHVDGVIFLSIKLSRVLKELSWM